MARPERFELPTFWFVVGRRDILKPCRCRTYRTYRLQNLASVGIRVGTRDSDWPSGCGPKKVGWSTLPRNGAATGVAVPSRRSGRWRKASPTGVTQCGVERVDDGKNIFANSDRSGAEV